MRRRAGFTLIEVLLTLVIMAGIMVSMTQILTVSRISRDQIHNTQERMLAGPAVLARLEEDLRGILTYNRAQTGILRIDNRSIAGLDADRIDFVTTTDSLIPIREHRNEKFQRADVNEVGFCLRLRPDNDDFLELYRREDFGIDDDPFDGGKFAFLHDRVKAFDIQIFEEDGPDAEPLESWGGEDDDEHQGLPARIELELQIETAPRLVREQIVTERRTITYRRIIRFPELVRDSLTIVPIPKVPQLVAPAIDTTGPGGQASPDDPFGGADGLSDPKPPGGDGSGPGGGGGGVDTTIFTGGG